MATLNINLDNVQPLNTLLTGISQLGYSGNAGLFLKVNATEDGFEFSAAGSSGISIGDSIGSGTAGSVLFLGASGVLAQDNTNLLWDYTNNRLLLGGATLEARLSIKASTSNSSEHALRIVDSNNINLFRFRNDGYFVIGGAGTNSGIDIQGTGTYAGIYSPAYSSNPKYSMKFSASASLFV